MRVLCVAEKPSQAKDIAIKLSDNTQRVSDTCAQYIKNYTFQLRWRNQPSTFTMTSLLGHIMELDFDVVYKRWNSCNYSELFNLPVYKKVAEDKAEIANNLQSLARQHDVLMIWTDCDREGENIGMEAVEIIQRANPQINIYRAKFSVMLPRELKYACDNPGTLDQNLVDAVEARSELDLRIGAALTRFQTLTFQRMFAELEGKIISYGSCQFPTLGFVVNRYLKIRDFVPVPFFKIALSHKRDDILVNFTWHRGELYDREVSTVLYEMCFLDGIAKVIKVESKPTTKFKPFPLTTVELQKMGTKYLRMTSAEVMEIANKLYQSGFISYPRTETDRFDPKFPLLPLIEKQLHDGGLLDGKFLPPRQGKHDDESHPPIHPTAAAPSLQGKEKLVYDFITRRFLAACSSDATGKQTTVQVEVGRETFTAKGLQVIEKNFLEIYPFMRWADLMLPNFVLGEQFEPDRLELVEGTTAPPKLLSEADLIQLMSKNGIGTDATIHEHIKKILDRDYVYQMETSKLFHPSNLGVGLVEGYDLIGLEKSLSKPLLRKEFEDSLKKICDGERDKDVVLVAAVEKYREVFDTASEKAETLIQALAKYLELNSNPAPAPQQRPSAEAVFKCPSCDRSMSLKTLPDTDKYFIGCTGWPECNQGIWFDTDKIRSVSLLPDICTNCLDCPTRKCKFNIVDQGAIAYYETTEMSTCIKCDTHFCFLLNISLRYPIGDPRITMSSAVSGSNTRNSTRTSSYQNSTNSSTLRCFKCNQSGHFANACPNSGNSTTTITRGGRTSYRSGSYASRARTARGTRGSRTAGSQRAIRTTRGSSTRGTRARGRGRGA